MNISPDMTYSWITTLNLVLQGRGVSPRGQLTKELPQHTVEVDMRHPVLAVPARKLSSKFLAAEAYWILSGDDSVSGIRPWNEHIAQFSDDGEHFFGAYGPRVVDQLPYVVATLLRDRDSRQAVITTWREKPPVTKDVPCTICFEFLIRDGKLNLHVFMRSSDVWLGLPYDCFNFSMLAHLVCCRLNIAAANLDNQQYVTPGTLYLTAGSSHLYERDFEKAHAILEQRPSILGPYRVGAPETPETLHLSERDLMDTLAAARSDLRARWWGKLS